MPVPDALISLQQALAAIDVMIRSGKGRNGQLRAVARDARRLSERLAIAARRRAAGERPPKAASEAVERA